MRIEIYQTKDGQYAWRSVARNGRITADGAETYSRKHDCKKAAFTHVQTIKLEGVDIIEAKEHKRQ